MSDEHNAVTGDDDPLAAHLLTDHAVEVLPAGGGLRFFGGHTLALVPGEPFDLAAFHNDLHDRAADPDTEATADERTPGQAAYEAYGETRGWRVFDGSPMPRWHQVTPEMAEAWEVAGAAAVRTARARGLGGA